MRIASTTLVGDTKAPGLLAKTPHMVYQCPICPTLLPFTVPEGELYEGRNNFREGTKYPVQARWMANVAHYCRPGRLIIRKESFYTATRRATMSDPAHTQRYDFPHKIGPLRVSGSGAEANYQYELACPKLGVVSQSIQDPPPPAGLVDYRIFMGYGFNPEIALSDAGASKPDAPPGTGASALPPWSVTNNAQTFINQAATVSAYFIEDVQSRALVSTLPRFGDPEEFPLERYEKCGKVKYDFRIPELSAELDYDELQGGFDLYRDIWFEDGQPPFTSPLKWRSDDALVSIAWVQWDKDPDGIIIPTQAMKDEIT